MSRCDWGSEQWNEIQKMPSFPNLFLFNVLLLLPDQYVFKQKWHSYFKYIFILVPSKIKGPKSPVFTTWWWCWIGSHGAFLTGRAVCICEALRKEKEEMENHYFTYPHFVKSYSKSCFHILCLSALIFPAQSGAWKIHSAYIVESCACENPGKHSMNTCVLQYTSTKQWLFCVAGCGRDK